MLRLWLVPALLLLAPGAAAASGRLYTEDDPLRILDGGSLKPAVTNSSSAWIVQFYSSWCGHCIQFSSTWKSLALDVQDWQQVISVAVLDCAQEENFDVCKEFGIKFYPTFKYFGAHAAATHKGTVYRGADRQIQSVRQLMVNILQNHTREERPDHCPPLQPVSSAELLPLLGQRSDHFVAVVAEEPESYVGREVILDLQQFSGVEVRRVLSSERRLLEELGVTHTHLLPQVHLLLPNGSHTLLHVEKRQRFFFSSALRSLPGVQRRPRSESGSGSESRSGSRSGSSHTVAPTDPRRTEPWRDFSSTQVYSADLESALHYLLRVEVAAHKTLEGAELQVFKDFVTLVYKLYPGRAPVVRLMETLSDWLLHLPLQRIPYQAVLDLVDNKMKLPGVFLGAELRWIGCQGSRAGLRGYPCALWTLFHVLSVQHEATPTALMHTGLEGEAAPVLQVMRRYIRTFFGCQECGRHFEAAAALGLDAALTGGPDALTTPTTLTTGGQQVLWLWNQHNMVNYRLAGSLSDDPLFPKAPWPSALLCASCHEEQSGVHVWNRDRVLVFLRRHYGAANLSPRYALPLPDPPRRDPVRTEPGEGPGRGAVGASGAGASGAGSTWILGFNSVDMSLCVVLYVSSCLFIMVLFFFFRVRSRRGKLRSRPHV